MGRPRTRGVVRSPHQGGVDVFHRGGRPMLRRQPVVDRDDHGVHGVRHRPAELVVGIEVAEHEPATVREDDDRQRVVRLRMRYVDTQLQVPARSVDGDVADGRHVGLVRQRCPARSDHLTKLRRRELGDVRKSCLEHSKHGLHVRVQIRSAIHCHVTVPLSSRSRLDSAAVTRPPARAEPTPRDATFQQRVDARNTGVPACGKLSCPTRSAPVPKWERRFRR